MTASNTANTSMTPDTKPDPTPGQEPNRAAEQLQKRIQAAQQRLESLIGSCNNPRLSELWIDWNGRLAELRADCVQRPQVEISLVGGTGAGKSTLVNALIGARVLPVSNMRACTAAISEVSYREGTYRARVEFIPRESWQREVDLLLGDLKDDRATDGTRSDDVQVLSDEVQLKIRSVAFDKLRTVYADTSTPESEQFDPFNLSEPPEVREVLDQGFVELESPDLKEFRAAVSKYLDSKHRFWPIVKTVSISGPFEVLRDGAMLVDLPGVNDPNESREEVTRQHLKNCRFVWIVFNLKRSLTKDIIELMRTDDFLRQIVMDGRADALTFVGTASDDINIESAIEEFDLDEDAEIPAVVAARNQAVRKIIPTQLEDLTGELGRLAGESEELVGRLARQLMASRVLTVSAREYMRMLDLSRQNPAGLTDLAQTEIPDLQDHMQSICAQYGVAAQLDAVNRQLNTLIAEIDRECESQRISIRNKIEATQQQREEVESAVNSAGQFLDQQFRQAADQLAQDVEAARLVLAERLKAAVDRARRDLEDTTLRRWRDMHHGTIKAACRRDGVYVGTTGRNDFSADLSKPILNAISFAWTDHFVDKLGTTLDTRTDALRRIVDDYRRRLLDSLQGSHSLSPELQQRMEQIMEKTEQILWEKLRLTERSIEAKVTDKQRTLYGTIDRQLQANMQPAYGKAADQVGSGMKQRMVQILCDHARNVSQIMFDEARDQLLNDVRSVNDWLCREYKTMIQTADRNARLVGTSLTTGFAGADEKELAQHSQFLEKLQRAVSELV